MTHGFYMVCMNKDVGGYYSSEIFESGIISIFIFVFYLLTIRCIKSWGKAKNNDRLK